MTIITKVGSFAEKATGLANVVLGSRILMYLLGAAVLALGFRWWLNAHDDKVWKASAAATSLAIKDGMQKEFDKRKAVNDALTKQALADKERAEARYAVITKMLDQSMRRLGDIMGAVKERQVVYVERAAAVPPNRLDGTIREVSRDIDSIVRSPTGEDNAAGRPPDR